VSNRRIVPFAVAGLLWFGLANTAIAEENNNGPVPTVTQTANAVTVSLPGVGTLSFSVDPGTGAVSSLVATADPSGGFTAGTPAISDEGVQVVFTSANGAPEVLSVEVEREDGALRVKAEAENDADDSPTSSTAPTAEVDGEHDGQPNTTPTTEVEHEHTTTTQMTSTTPTSEDGHGSDGGSSDGGGTSDSGQSGSGGDSGSGGGQD